MDPRIVQMEVANHESRHAVIGIRLGRRVKDIEFRPDDGIAGIVRLGPRGEAGIRWRMATACSAMAGAIYDGDSSPGDRAVVMETCPRGLTPNSWWLLVEDETKRLLAEPGVARAVTALARHLHDHRYEVVPGAVVHRIVEEALGEDGIIGART